MLAYQLNARFIAGLTLVGIDESGYLFTGTKAEWGEADAQEEHFEEHGKFFGRETGPDRYDSEGNVSY